MVNFCYEAHFWRFEGVIVRDFNVNFVDPALFTVRNLMGGQKHLHRES